MSPTPTPAALPAQRRVDAAKGGWGSNLKLSASVAAARAPRLVTVPLGWRTCSSTVLRANRASPLWKLRNWCCAARPWRAWGAVDVWGWMPVPAAHNGELSAASRALAAKPLTPSKLPSLSPGTPCACPSRGAPHAVRARRLPARRAVCVPAFRFFQRHGAELPLARQELPTSTSVSAWTMGSTATSCIAPRAGRCAGVVGTNPVYKQDGPQADATRHL